MRISAKIDYACRALMELSLHWPDTAPVRIQTIARSQRIPIKFLTQILLNLKQLGYVQSVRGKSGGYILAKAPKEITLKETVQSFVESDPVHPRFLRDKNANVFTFIWREIEEETSRTMAKITFDEIIKRERCINKVPMFTI